MGVLESPILFLVYHLIGNIKKGSRGIVLPFHPPPRRVNVIMITAIMASGSIADIILNFVLLFDLSFIIRFFMFRYNR